GRRPDEVAQILRWCCSNRADPKERHPIIFSVDDCFDHRSETRISVSNPFKRLIVELARCSRGGFESFVTQLQRRWCLPLREQGVGLHEQADPFRWFAKDQRAAFARKNFFTQCLA